ncbi:MAG: hypothetical protein JWP87_5677 [Labilithrix sp.]|nr:hypothetical protein [Labilithrix sp.]
MNTATMLGLAAAVMAMATAACSADTTDEKTGKTEDHFDVACVRNIQAPTGSPAWRDALQACLSDVGAGGGGGYTPPAPGGGGGESCSISTSCVNGSCTCGSGPNEGAACDGAIVTGASACSVLCHYCQ